ncbi:MAG: YfhO family protein [Ligilactobacillus sp.]|nr:YfhO family protein [Ligilactobacillus sp.]
MHFSFEKKKRSKLYLSYTLFFLVGAFFMYGTYLITGHALIWDIDAANQHLPLLESYRQLVIDFWKHPSLTTWSLKMGLGSDTFQVYSYYVIGDLFNYLTLLIPAKFLVVAYQALIGLRLYFAGLSFIFVASHFNFQKRNLIAGAGVYLFNAFVLYASVAHPFFTTPFIIFPLLIWGIERVLQKKSAWPLLAVFTWMLISNFYFAFMLGIGALLYLALRVGFTYRHTLNYPQVFAKLAWATIIALLLAAGLLIPELYAVTSSTRAAASFANGLTFYPLYYYLALPSQLINGGNRDFYFWSALGFASIAFYAVTYVVIHAKRYPILCASFALSLVMFLLPFFGALFNGGMSPSNRWSLMLCLPMALAVCLLLEEAPNLSARTLKIFSLATLVYLIWISGNYFFDNDQKIFIPIIFLLVTLGFLYAQAYQINRHPQTLTGLVLINLLLNIVYYEAPYNGGFTDEALATGTYEKLANNRYDGLDSDLTASDNYRVSTISHNYYLGANYDMYNTLNASVHSITSYYSLQNKYLGNFMRSLQNIQYEATRPTQQVDDRSILNNFLGVQYIFSKINRDNSQKVPANYFLDRTSRKITDVNGQSSHDQQTRRYRTNLAFPLVYFQNQVFTPQHYRQLTASQKERALAEGVLVSQKASQNLPKKNLKDVTSQVIEVPIKIVSSRGNHISSQDLIKEDTNERYQILVAPTSKDFSAKDRQELLKKLANSEIHLEVTNIKYHPFSLQEQLALEKRNNYYAQTNGFMDQNLLALRYKYFHYHILQGSPDPSYTLAFETRNGTEEIVQRKQSSTSFYQVIKNGTVNLGSFSELPSSITFTPSKLGHYDFKLKLVALPLGENSSYQKQVQAIQKHSLQNFKVTPTGFSGNITINHAGILTSSIPYSPAWQVKVDNHKQTVLKTNQAFVGVKLKPGKHRVQFSYTIPGLKAGFYLSGLGLILLAISSLISLFNRRRKSV